MHPGKEEAAMTEYRIAISVTARFAISGKLYPETFYWHGRLYTIEKIRKVSYFSGDTYGTQDRVFLVKYGETLFPLFYIGGKWYVELKDPEQDAGVRNQRMNRQQPDAGSPTSSYAIKHRSGCGGDWRRHRVEK